MCWTMISSNLSRINLFHILVSIRYISALVDDLLSLNTVKQSFCKNSEMKNQNDSQNACLQ